VKGSKIVFDTSFAPNVGKRTGRVKAEYERENVHVNTDVLLEAGGPLVTAASVFGYEGWLGGVQGAYSTQQGKLVSNSIALGYKHPKYILHTFVSNGSEFGGSVYHKVNGDLELSASLGWRQGVDGGASTAATMGVAAQYKVDKDLVVRGKVTNTSQVGLAMTHTLKPGLKLTLSCLSNLRNFNEGGHKFGVGVEFESPN